MAGMSASIDDATPAMTDAEALWHVERLRMDEVRRQDQLRVEALTVAARAEGSASQVVRRARAYHEFLTDGS